MLYSGVVKACTLVFAAEASSPPACDCCLFKTSSWEYVCGLLLGVLVPTVLKLYSDVHTPNT